ncbi:aspartate aminotransferase family protein [Massilia rubra]|uniref:Aminotransferase class III-fold pyridoxal phosphate-dependent enzyme n=1 Tax=Massilia rubra TaxID=2607910 RepID=A0ABX0LQC6_9BURK|nr:aminotransferase class III-fold pyridoxal phosphate-dependent enzyme [Massilia rubra]NHZ36788.1 aminotransferase class III-fold pyridoxal phosphate-dependent enzyme [Massilia rubra]
MTFNTARSKSYNDRLKQVVPGGAHYSFRMPWESKQIHFVGGHGARLRDMDGNEYLDFFSKFGANILGHNDRRYNARLADILNGAAAVNLGANEAEAAEMICAFVPSAEMVRFSLSGTDAVLNALRLARAYTGKSRFIRFFTHYHGNADSLLGGRVGNLDYPLAESFDRDITDTDGKASGATQEAFLLPWNDLPTLERVLSAYGDQIAAVLTEPICINGGGVAPQAGYLEGMRRLCDAHGIVLVFDEVITGFRVGLGGAQALVDVMPDLTTLGKAMAGGALPVSAIAGRREIMNLYTARKVVHGGTFNGYALGMAAVRATLDILSEDNGDCYTHLATHMRKIHHIFVHVAAQYGLTFEIQGLDAAGVFHFRPRAELGASSAMIAQYAVKLTSEAMAECGILVSNMNRLYGSIAVDDSDIALFEERIDEVFKIVAPFVEKMQENKPATTRPSAPVATRGAL